MARPLVMIHGMWSDPAIWDNWRGHFARLGWQVLTPALRHHDGPADLPPPAELGETGLLDYAADLETLIRDLAEPPVLIGHGMGGLLAQMLAARGLAGGLVLVAPAPPAGGAAVSLPLLRTMGRIMLRPSFSRQPQRLTFEEAAQLCFNLLSGQRRRAEYGRLRWDSGRALSEMALWFLDKTKAAQVDPRRIVCPVLVVAAGEDRLVPSATARQVARRYAPAAGYCEFRDHAHWLPLEDGWEAPAAAVAAWLERSAGQTAVVP